MDPSLSLKHGRSICQCIPILFSEGTSWPLLMSHTFSRSGSQRWPGYDACRKTIQLLEMAVKNPAVRTSQG